MNMMSPGLMMMLAQQPEGKFGPAQVNEAVTRHTEEMGPPKELMTPPPHFQDVHIAWKLAPIIANLFDAYSTNKAISAGKGLKGSKVVEANTAMAPFASNPALFTLTKLLVGLMSAKAVDNIAKGGNPNAAKAASIGASAIPMGLGISNLGVTKEANKLKKEQNNEE